MQKKNGISLIVLVITIIVMIILAAAVVIAMTNNGIIERANQAVNLTNEKQVQDLASLIWAEAYMDPAKKTDIENVVKEELRQQGITDDKWDITISSTGVTVKSRISGGEIIKPENKNEINITIRQDEDSYETIDMEDYVITINGEAYTALGTYTVPVGATVECTIAFRGILGMEPYITYNGIVVIDGRGDPYTFTANKDVTISLGGTTGETFADIIQVPNGHISATIGARKIVVEAGTTWAQWLADGNKRIGYYGEVSISGNAIKYDESYFVRYNGVNVLPTDVIVSGAEYEMYWQR